MSKQEAKNKRPVETENNTSPDKRKAKKAKPAPGAAPAAATAKKGGAPANNNGGSASDKAKKLAAKQAAAKAAADAEAAAAAAADVKRDGDEDDDEAPVDTEALQKLDELQEKLDAIDTKLSYEAMLLEKKYAKEKAPLYNERAKAIALIPHFWQKVIGSHPQIPNVFEEDDKQVFDHLTDFAVVQLKDPAVGYTISFTFNENPFFENKKLEKKYEFVKPGSAPSKADEDLVAPRLANVSCTQIKWKTAEFAENNPSSFFVQWFDHEQAKDDLTEDELAEALKEEVWKNPLALFVNTLGGDSDDDDVNLASDGEDDAEADAEAAALAGDDDE